MKALSTVSLGLLTMFGACSEGAAAREQTRATSPAAHDYSKDQKLAQQVHQAVIDDASQLAVARDLQVTASHGTVTLRGRVLGQAHKDAIADKARGVAGVQNVVNALTVKASTEPRERGLPNR